MTINDRLRSVLQALDIKPRLFAQQAGIDPAVFHNIISEKGRQNKPSFDVLEKILLSFDNLNAEYLITGKGQIFKDQNSLIEQRYNFPKSKNEMYIKPPEKGVRIESQK